jgi:hypothetical protein
MSKQQQQQQQQDPIDLVWANLRRDTAILRAVLELPADQTTVEAVNLLGGNVQASLEDLHRLSRQE